MVENKFEDLSLTKYKEVRDPRGKDQNVMKAISSTFPQCQGSLRSSQLPNLGHDIFMIVLS